MANRSNIAAVVVLYNPSTSVLNSITSYHSEVDAVYAIDNSETGSMGMPDWLKTVENVVYIPNRMNLGIARALNMAAERANREGYQFLLTMDQDSEAQQGMLQALIACAEQNGERTAIVSPVHRYLHSPERGSHERCREVLTAITSGNLLNLKAYQAVGPFRDDFFIDHVDDEYCLRLRLKGYRVMMASEAVLEHRLGSASEHRLLFHTFAVSNHPPTRKYYAIRNRFYLRKQYHRHFKAFFRFFFLKLLREAVTVLIYEREKRQKIRMMLEGYRDYRKGITGKHLNSREVRQTA